MTNPVPVKLLAGRIVYVDMPYSAPYRNQPVVAIPVKGAGSGTTPTLKELEAISEAAGLSYASRSNNMSSGSYTPGKTEEIKAYAEWLDKNVSAERACEIYLATKKQVEDRKSQDKQTGSGKKDGQKKALTEKEIEQMIEEAVRSGNINPLLDEAGLKSRYDRETIEKIQQKLLAYCALNPEEREKLWLKNGGEKAAEQTGKVVKVVGTAAGTAAVGYIGSQVILIAGPKLLALAGEALSGMVGSIAGLGAVTQNGGALAIQTTGAVAVEDVAAAVASALAGAVSLSTGKSGSSGKAGVSSEEKSESKTSYKAGDKTPGGREYTDHGAQRANRRGFDSKKIDNIIDNNYKTRVKEINKSNGKVTWRYQDKRGNTVITNELGDKIVSVYSHPGWVNGSKYIPKK